MSYNEIKTRGTADFPIELYFVNKSHDQYTMVSHWHSELEIIRILSGTLNIHLNNNVYIAEKGSVILVNPETVHSAIPSDCVYECLVFDISLLSGLCDGIKYFVDGVSNGEYVMCEILKDSDIKAVLDEAFDTMKCKSSGYKFKVIGSLYKFLGVIVDKHFYNSVDKLSHNPESKKIPIIKNVISFINENYSSHLTLTDMAKIAEMSPKYFCYFFKELTTKTPFQYLSYYRIEEASKKLLNTNLSVTEIAFSCGFNDLSYFIKTFKQIKGITPAKFKKEKNPERKKA